MSGIHYFGSGGSGVYNPPVPVSRVAGSLGDGGHANPLMGLLGAGHDLLGGGETHAGGVLGGGLAAIIHSLLGGGMSPHAGGIAAAGELAPHGGGAPDALSSFGAPTPPPGVTPPPQGSYNPAQFYRAMGHPQYAAELWESHHPYAVRNHHIPHWVTQALLHAIQNATPQAAAPPVPTNQAQ